MNRDLNKLPKGSPENLPDGGLDDDAVRHALRSLPWRSPSREVRNSLRALASRERLRAAAGVSTGASAGKFIVWTDRLHLFSRDLMRPLALPFGGGVFSAVLAFSMWLSTGYPVQAAGGFDIPTPLSPRSQVTTLVTKDPSVL